MKGGGDLSKGKKKKKMGEAQKYLSSIKELDEMIDNKQRHRDYLFARLTNMTSTLKQDVVIGGGGEDYTKEKWIDLKNELDIAVDHYCDLQKEAINLLEQLRTINHNYYQVLYKKYILYDTLEDIASDMAYTYQWVCKLHGRALQTFDAVLREHKE